MIMMTFNDFVYKHKLINKATSNVKKYEVLRKIRLDSKMRTYLRDGPFSSSIGVVKLHPSNGTHWVFYINESYFDSYGCVPHRKLSKFFIKRNGHCLYSECQIQKNDSFCASYCLFIICLAKMLGIDFKSAAFNLWYQRLS